jgi:glucose-6-phosphate dehydrogenase assembly protein OpcA
LTEPDLTWSAEDTTPSEVAGALAGLLAQRHHENACFVPARVLNLVAVVDRAWRGEIENRLARVGRYHASRTIVCAIEPGRRTIRARALVSAEGDPRPGEIAALHERVVLELGERHVPHLDSVVDPLVVTDLSTMVWSPHGHDDAVDVLMPLVQVVLLDTADEPDPREALARAGAWGSQAYIVDLSWLRSTPWRERVASAFDPPTLRAELRRIRRVQVRHRPDSAPSALLLVGWLASRLGWRPERLVSRNGAGLAGRLTARRGDVTVELAPTDQAVRGLQGITVETASGLALSLDRGEGGLVAHRRDPRGREQTWTVLGASRGEPGVLGEGIRQALLRDPTYPPALAAARELVA